MGTTLDDRKTQQYGNLFFLLQSEPRHVAALCRLVSLAEIDTLLQTVMFTLYGNQYESREEHLLLTMFQVSGRLWLPNLMPPSLTRFRRPSSPCFRLNSKQPPTLVPCYVPTRRYRV